MLSFAILAALTLTQCDSVRVTATETALRAEASRPRNLSPRRTVVRELADSLNAACRVVSVPVPPVDTQPTPPVDTVITPPPIDTAPPAPSVVELPRQFLTWTRPAPTRTVNVPVGANLQTALNSAQRGDELVLPAGASWTGNYSVSSCGPGWITVRAASVPSHGQRITPSMAAQVAKLVTNNSLPAIHALPSSCRWAFIGFEVTIAPTVTVANYGLIRFDGADLVQDGLYVHGQPNSHIVRCTTANGTRQQFLNGWYSECHAKGQQAQAIAGWNGAGPFRIVGNYLEGSGENVMFGGADPTVLNLIPADIEIRRNHFNKPASYNGLWDNLNLLESKNMTRALIEANVFEGSWATHGQDNAVIFKSANQSGGCRWCRTTDVTFRFNRVSRNTTGVALAGFGYTGPNDSVTARIAITDNHIDAGSEGGNRRGIQLVARAQVQSVFVERNLVTGPLSVALWAEGGAPCRVNDNVFSKGQYGAVFATGGGTTLQVLDKFCAPWTFSGNTVLGATAGYPAGTLYAPTEAASAAAVRIRAAVDSATRGVVVPPQ